MNPCHLRHRFLSHILFAKFAWKISVCFGLENLILVNEEVN